MTNILIIGAGHGCSQLLPILASDKEIKIIGIIDKNPSAPAIPLAKEYGIPVFTDIEDTIKKNNFNVVVNVTGNEDVLAFLRKTLPSSVEIIGGLSSKLFWQFVSERQKREEDLKKNLKEHDALYQIGIQLSSAERSQKIFDIILTSAMELTNRPAGSIVIIDEKSGMLRLVLAKGFSQKFISESSMWLIRPKGLTSVVMDSNKPTIISDITKESALSINPSLIEEGVKSIAGIPLHYAGKIVGILYLNDFISRGFTEREISILNLMATQAALAIEKMRLLEKVEQLAITDELTQIYNHRYFNNALSNEIYRAARYKHPVSLIIIDIDNFKNYNDLYGHVYGNFVLALMADIFRRSVRTTDTAARYGGEEFAIILPETKKDTAIMLAERIRNEVASSCQPEKNRQIMCGMTISLGVAAFNDDADNEEDLVKKADEAMYEAKKLGKNKVIAYSPKIT
ncbi:MAG: diguanylate cyclase [Deltaproteobacteria bacterium]|nr:diguanylate cyclase [Deltaproteobacteria bacterium]